ncbi:lamin-like protein [Hibiscus syriacus]|uniref:lamin-like protein n=1 Tax=Hibiscus syriacus TaxID=106335 RepID=UPI0019238DA6|nr:lamin-like protein [Hibiscus syriacus]
MLSSTSNLLLRVCSVLLVLGTVAATDHIVGANKGWNPGINYTLWANNQTFYVGDFISFRYQKTQYNVFEVNRTGYDNCTTEGALGNWSNGKDFILLNKSLSQWYYFICGNGQCFNGMKVSVFVQPLPSPTASPVPHHASNSTSAAGLVVLPRGLAGLRALAVALASIWFGSGWI